ncbi:MAG: hypothetical protein U0235_13675 [Polyangiaceae bacterium]
MGGNAEMLAKLEFKEGQDPDLDPEGVREGRREVPRSLQEEGEEKFKEAGGLHIVGTERHGRAASTTSSAAAPGARRPGLEPARYLSLESDLMRIFAGDKVKSLMERMGMPDGKPIGMPWVTNRSATRSRGQGPQLRHPQAPPRVRRRDERAAQDGLPSAPATSPRPVRPRSSTTKATGKLREIDDRRSATPSRTPVRDMITSPADRHRRGRRCRARGGKSVDMIKVKNLAGSSRTSTFYKGYELDYKDEDGRSRRELHDRIGECRLLTEQRERLLDPASTSASSTTAASRRAARATIARVGSGRRCATASATSSARRRPRTSSTLGESGDVAHELYKSRRATSSEKRR